jgi:hypothetical protein
MSRFTFLSAAGIALLFLSEGVLSTPADGGCASTCTADFTASADFSNNCANQATGSGKVVGHFDTIDNSVLGNVDVAWSAPNNKLTLSVTAGPPIDGFCFQDIRYAAYLPSLTGSCDLDAIPDDQEVYYASFGSWCSGETNVFEVKLDPATTAATALCVAVWAEVVDPVCLEAEDCVGPEPFECAPSSTLSPSATGKGKSKKKSAKKSKDICRVRESRKSCDEAETSWCATSFIKLERFCFVQPTPPPPTSTGPGARWKYLNNGATSANGDAFYAGRSNLGGGVCRNGQRGVTYVYNGLNELEMKYDADANTWNAQITPAAGSPIVQTVDLDDLSSACTPTPYEENWDALKIQISNRGAQTGTVRLTDVKFNNVAVGNFCITSARAAANDFYFYLGGYNLSAPGTTTTVTANLVLCGATSSNFDSNENDKVEISFVKL